ncbi:hypothetical protein Lal_00038085 [Lupinus albus]|uniref:Putative oxoglutarate/iron-dependent dioxygenase, non-hem dioxygenase domain-containing protein n=1 Tax=Lupinus albus TaxID=3870 RepID=A0A6A4QZA2_LUPAL|nr:putative oxoglutarate/iron-dependent dioxygenase, non-hem dioxygenase domain-containing protein [Lupinus albus]KAF1877776.1 hypothetical protein Lal_00038085 [Lupinus albus]
METQTVYESQFPVIDFTTEKMKPGNDEWFQACKVVRRGFEEHGGFLARFDKVGSDLLNSVFSSMEELFCLPFETKSRKTSDKPNHGYSGQFSASPLFESFAVDNPSNIEDCQKFTQIMWPQGNNRFCESVNTYGKLLLELDQTVKKMVFDSYGLDREKCECFLESTNYAFRSYKYRIPEMNESNIGVNPHTDSTLITILHQQINGLEIRLKNGEWINIDASPSLFCILAGDALVVWSSERIRACEHRVILKSKVIRYSLGLLSYSTKMVQTLDDLVDEEHPIRYKPFDHYGYLDFRFTEEALKSTNRIKAYCGI